MIVGIIIGFVCGMAAGMLAFRQGYEFCRICAEHRRRHEEHLRRVRQFEADRASGRVDARII